MGENEMRQDRNTTEQKVEQNRGDKMIDSIHFINTMLHGIT
jgi:hypothetical protein